MTQAPSEAKRQRIDMLMGSKTSQMEIYDAKISSIDGSFKLEAKLTKINKTELLTIDNPEYGNLIERYQHLDAVRMDDRDSKERLPIYVILGVGEYARIKMSPGAEFDKGTMFMTQTSWADFEDLCRMHVLGFADTSESDQVSVYQDFKEQLQRDSTGWYETSLSWKSNHPHLPTNEAGSRRRLDNLVKRLTQRKLSTI